MTSPEGRAIDVKLCRVGGQNQNYVSAAGTPCHIQIEDYGPMVDRASEEDVRRVNVIVYANYGTPQARIVFGRDYDYPDVRTTEYNQIIQGEMGQLIVQAQTAVEQLEQRELGIIRASLSARRELSDEALRAEFQECATLYPTLFKRALGELRGHQARAAAAAPAPAAPPVAAPLPPVEEPAISPGVPAQETVYPLDDDRRRRVIEIEALIVKLGQDFLRLKAYGLADDILLQRCRKLVDQARASISRAGGDDLQTRMLDLTLENMAKTWRQVRSQLQAHERR